VTITDSTGNVDTVTSVGVLHFSDGTNYLVGKQGLVQTSDQTINQFLANSGVDQSYIGPVPTAGAQQQPVQTATPASLGRARTIMVPPLRVLARCPRDLKNLGSCGSTRASFFHSYWKLMAAC
jgi:hypothetical protein